MADPMTAIDETAALMAMEERIAVLDAENAKLREGLEFYAWVDHYLGWPGISVVAEDKGRRARARLQGQGGDDGKTV